MIIDFHVHIFPENVAPKALKDLSLRSGITPFTNGTLKDTINKLEKNNIDKCVFLNIATKASQMRTINNTAVRLNKEHINYTSFGSVHPDSPDCLDELYRIKELNIKGIKLHPDYQDFFADDKRVYPIYDLCGQLSIPIVMHTGWDCYSPDVIHAVPEKLMIIAKEFPKTKFIFAHMGGLRFWHDVETYIVGLENVYFDTSFCVNGKMDTNQATKIVLSHPKENTLFGSDCPWENVQDSIEFVDSLDIPDSFKERIYSANALNLISFD